MLEDTHSLLYQAHTNCPRTPSTPNFLQIRLRTTWPDQAFFNIDTPLNLVYTVLQPHKSGAKRLGRARPMALPALHIRLRRSTRKCVSKRMTNPVGRPRPADNPICPTPARLSSPPLAACVPPPPVVAPVVVANSLTGSSNRIVRQPCVDRATKL